MFYLLAFDNELLEVRRPYEKIRGFEDRASRISRFRNEGPLTHSDIRTVVLVPSAKSENLVGTGDQKLIAPLSSLRLYSTPRFPA